MTRTRPRIENLASLQLSPEWTKILHIMFADYRCVEIKRELGGGLSGGRVLLVRPIKHDGQPELPAVVKMAPVELIKKEWHAYREYVRDRLPGIAEIRGEPVVPQGSSWGGLRYTSIGGGVFEVTSLHSYCRDADVEDVCHVLKDRLFRRMEPLWEFSSDCTLTLQRSYDRLLPINLLIEPAVPPPGSTTRLLKAGTPVSKPPVTGDYVRLEGYVITEVDPEKQEVTLNLPARSNGPPDSYRLRLQPVAEIEKYRTGDIIDPVVGVVTADRCDLLKEQVRNALGQDVALDGDTVLLPGGVALPNPLSALPDLLSMVRNVRVACVHGDFNLENTLVDPVTRDVGLIDFADARHDHVLHDLLRLETETITKLVSEALAAAEQPPETIAAFYEQLHLATFHPDRHVHSGPPSANLEKTFRILVAIRQAARNCLSEPNDWREYYQCLALYLLGALKFKNLDRLPMAPLPKQAAFWAAAMVCGFVKPAGLPTRVYWEPLRKYLPAELYQGKDGVACLAHLRQLLRAVATYLPRHLALELLREPAVAENRGGFLEGTLLFTDVSSFTSLSEELKATDGNAGTEALVRLINAYLDVMLDILYKYNGHLIKFGGDGMLCLFTGSGMGAMNAVWAAWEMRQAIRERLDEAEELRRILPVDELEVVQKIMPLNLKAASNSGLLFAASVGNEEHMEYILTGSAVERTAYAEAAAGPGDILISQDTYELVKHNLDVEELAQRPGIYRLQEIRVSPPPTGSDLWANVETTLTDLAWDFPGIINRLDALTPYLPAGVLPQLVSDPQQGQIEGQYRQATVLFANFAGMSDIIHARGIGDEAGITADLSEYLVAMQEEIQYYGGMINKVDLYDQGDKLMVIFGAPQAHERDARRAALTALAMQEAMGRLSSPTATMFLSQRIGIHRGSVFAGNVGSSSNSRREYTAMGDAVNLTERLMSVAQPGEVWISQAIWDQIQDDFEAEVEPSIELKGIRDPLTVYRLRRSHERQESRVWVRALRSDMVGRKRELETLQACYECVLSGSKKRVIAIAGEAGVGKTRLVAEWQQRAAIGSETAWLSGRGHSYGQKVHGVFIEILQQLLDFTDKDSQEQRWAKLSARLKTSFTNAESGWLDEFLNRLAYLGRFLGLDLSARQGLTERVDRVEAEALQIETRLAVCDLLAHAARERPLTLVLEDLHWADDASLDMLAFVLERVGNDIPMLWCLLYRPQKEHPIWRLWKDIEHSDPDCLSIQLHELGEADGRQLLSNLLQTTHLPKDFLALILKETDGNPLYVEEVLHALIEEGAIIQGEGGWQIVRSVDRIRVPDTLYQIIQSRIDELDFRSPGARRVLWMAAVIGETFDEDLLRHLLTSTGRPEEEFTQHFQELRDAAMIQRGWAGEGDGRERRYQFRHGLVQQVAYENMLVEKRRQYHRTVAHWLEERHRQHLPEYYETLAYHYDRGQEWEKARHYHRLAGEKNARAFANQDATYHLRRALELTADPSMQADTYWLSGKVYDQWGRSEEALEALDRGLELAGPDPSVLRARLLGRRSSVSISTGRLIEAERDALESLKIAQGVSGLYEEAYAHNNLGAVYGIQGQYEQALEQHTRSLTARRDLGTPYEIGQSLLNVGTTLACLGKFDEAEAHYREALQVQKRVGARHYEGGTYHNLGWLHLDQGETEKAEREFSRALNTWEQIEHRKGVAFVHHDLGGLYLKQDRLDEAQSHLERAVQVYEEMGAHSYLSGSYGDLAQVCLGLNQTQGALEAAQQALKWARSIEDRRQEATAQCTLGTIHLARAKESDGTESSRADALAEAERCAQTGLELARTEPPLSDVVGAATELLEDIRRT